MTHPDTAQAAAPFKPPFRAMRVVDSSDLAELGYIVVDFDRKEVSVIMEKDRAEYIAARLNQPTPPEQEREAFERWFNDPETVHPPAPANYDHGARLMWSAWQARAAAPASPARLTEDERAFIANLHSMDRGCVKAINARENRLLAIIERITGKEPNNG